MTPTRNKPRSKGRTGRPWRRLRQRVLAQGRPCSLCGMPIDLSISYPHPMSPAIDHTVPLVLGGLPLDSRNATAAHKVCNEAKELARRSSVRQVNLGVSRQW